MNQEMAYYETYPKVFLAGQPSRVTIRPLGGHAAFAPDTDYVVQILPMEGQMRPHAGENDMNYPHFECRSTDGCIRFAWTFETEQEYLIRVFLPPRLHKSQGITTQRVYAVRGDLYGRRPYRADFHMHTTYSDGRESPAFVAASYRRAGFDLIAITDHRTMQGSLEAIAAYRDVPLDLRVYPGEEVQLDLDGFDDGHEQEVHSVHVGGGVSINRLAKDNLAGYKREIDAYIAAHPQPEGVDAVAVASCHWIYQKIREAGGMSVLCHPHWRENCFHLSQKLLDRLFELQEFDAFEVLGGCEEDTINFQTAYYHEKRAEGMRVPIVGSSDSHATVEAEHFGWYATVVLSPSKDFTDVKGAIEGLYSVAVEAYPGQVPRVCGPYRLVKYIWFLLKTWFPLHDTLCAEEGRLMLEYANGSAEAAEALRRCQGRTDRLMARYFGAEETV